MSRYTSLCKRIQVSLVLLGVAFTLCSLSALAQTTLRTAYYDNANPPNIHQLSWSNGNPVDVNTGFQGQSGSGYFSMSGVTAPISHIFHIGPNGHIYDLFKNGTWQNFDATAAAGALSANALSPLTSFRNPNNGYMHVYYLSGTHVLELIWTGGTTWTKFDPSAAAIAPDAVQDGPLTCFQAGPNNVIHVYYLGGDAHIHELYWTGGTTWTAFDPTAAAGAGGAFFTGGITSFYYNGKIYIYYIGINDSALHELVWQGGTTWSTSCPGCAAGAPTVTSQNQGEVTSLVDTTNGKIHVYYQGAGATGSSVIELISSGGGWTYDIPLFPKAFNSLFPIDSFFTGGTTSIWVHYTDDSSHLHALSFSGGSWSDTDVTSRTGVITAPYGGSGGDSWLTSY